jgi:hypothetical protein
VVRSSVAFEKLTSEVITEEQDSRADLDITRGEDTERPVWGGFKKIPDSDYSS